MTEDKGQPEKYQGVNESPCIDATATLEVEVPIRPPSIIDEKERGKSSQKETLPEVKEDGASSGPTGTTSTLPPDAGAQRGTGSNPQEPAKRTFNPLKRNPPPLPTKRCPSLEHDAGWTSKLTFQWMQPLMATGYKRPLELNDLWLVNPDRNCDILTSKLNASFKRRREDGNKLALLRALYDVFKVEFLLGGLYHFLQTIFQVVSPFLMRYLISFAHKAWNARHSGGTAPPTGHGIGIVLGIVALQVAQSLCGNQFLYYGMAVGGQCRAVLMAVIFDKALRLSGRARAGGKPLEPPPPDIRLGSPEEKRWYRRVFNKEIRKKGVGIDDMNGNAGVAGDGHGYTNGTIINLMSTDTHRIDQGLGLFHMLWCAPLAILITLILLIINLSYSALAGFALLLVGVLILSRVTHGLLKQRTKINRVTDERVGLTYEILQAVRFVKFFGWEASFLDRISAIRKKEISFIRVLLGTRNAINAISSSMPIFSSMVSFILFYVTKHPLDPAPVFSSLALFNGLRMPLGFFPLVLGQVVDAISSIKRVEELLLAEEVADDFIWDFRGKNAVEIKNGQFSWERTPSEDPNKVDNNKNSPSFKQMAKDKRRDQKLPIEQTADEKSGGTDGIKTHAERGPFKIENFNLTVGHGELVAVIGSVGSGKSSLLAALAAEMRRTGGIVTLGASRAFCPQYAWIQNATLRDNIVLSQDLNTEWYEKVIDACALRADLEMLPNGDMTEIGERGITISGGQKQRLNVARAIYSNADLILLDDPLSAVDAHVGRHIMENAICGLLKGKARIMATHQLNILHQCDRVVWMREGRIIADDTFPNLMANSEAFQKLMATAFVGVEKKVEDRAEDGAEEEKQNSPINFAKGTALMTTEERALRSVSWGVYKAYLKAAGGYWVGPLLLIILVMSQALAIATSLWLSFWTAHKWEHPTKLYIGVYASLGVSQALITFLFSFGLSVFGTQASKHMLHDAMRSVLYAPVSFFDTTPLGRIANRFSKDIDTMDNNLSDAMRMYFTTIAIIISVFILVIVYFPFFATALVPLFACFCFTAAYYRASAREIKRLEAIQRSFVFSKFSEAILGVTTIRAYRLEAQFMASLRQAIDDMNSAYFLTFTTQRWLGVRLDVVGNLLIFIVGILVITSRFTVNPSIIGLVLSYILSTVQMIQFAARQVAEVDNNMNATERVHYYATQLEQEAPLKHKDIPQSWPAKGDIIFDNVQMRYRKGLPLVLNGFNLRVKGGEHIGIVGRTGAGKSSILSTLFRVVELSGGSITIDDIDIAKVGLQDLRSRLAIIPQDPVLFRGTIRSNLDPFDERTDLDLWSALRQVDLVDHGLPNNCIPSEDGTGHITLDTVVEEEGLNFSLGERQMMALARALVRGSQIIVCDEATSSVDFETDYKIQQTIMTAFKGKTLICIAHRLRTTISYDRIVVMDAGQIAEVDSPLKLFDAGGIFRSMCERSGIIREELLRVKPSST